MRDSTFLLGKVSNRRSHPLSPETSEMGFGKLG
jgi:hypothetical protein